MKKLMFGFVLAASLTACTYPGARPGPVHHSVRAPAPRHFRPMPMPYHGGHHVRHYHLGLPVFVGAVIGAGIVHAVYDTYYVEKVWVPETKVLTGYDVNHNPVYAVTPAHWEYRHVVYQ